MAVTIVNHASSAIAPEGTASASIASFAISGGDTLVVVVGVSAAAAAPPDAVRFNNTEALSLVTEITSNSSPYYAGAIWRLTNPSNVTANIDVKWPYNIDELFVAAYSLSGVDQTTPVGDFTAAETTSSGITATVSTVASGGLTIDLIYNDYGATAVPQTTNTIAEYAWGLGGYSLDAATSYLTASGSTSTQMGWYANCTDGVVLAAAFRPAAATGQATESPANATLLVTGLAPSAVIQLHKTRSPSYGTMLFSGLAPTSVTSIGSAIEQPGYGTVLVQGLAPSTSTLNTPHTTRSPATGTLQIAGLAPTTATKVKYTRSPGTGILDFVGLAPSRVQIFAETLSPGLFTMTVQGLAPTLDTQLQDWVAKAGKTSSWTDLSETASTWTAISATASTWTAISKIWRS